LSCCCRCRRSRQGRPPPAAKRVDVSRACKLASLPSFLFLLTSLFPFRSEKNPMLFPLFLLQGGNNWGGGGNNNNGGGNNNNGGGQVSAERRQASERKRRGSRRRRKSEGENSPYLSLPLSRFLQTLPARLERRPEPGQGQQRRPERKRERRQRSQRKRRGSLRRRKKKKKKTHFLSLSPFRFLQTLAARLERRPKPEQGQQRRPKPEQGQQRRPKPEQGQQRRPERKRERRQRSQRKRRGS